MDADVMAKAKALAATAGAEQAQNLIPKEQPLVDGSTQNPAQRPGRTSAERQRVPMSVPMLRLSVPEIPGYHLHWFRGTQERINRAQGAGYSFVHPEEVDINNLDIGGESAVSGNTDMGSRVSVVSGDEVGRDGQPIRLILMKLPIELWDQDVEALINRSEQVAGALRSGTLAAGQAGRENQGDIAQRYVKQGSNLFTRKPQR